MTTITCKRGTAYRVALKDREQYIRIRVFDHAGNVVARAAYSKPETMIAHIWTDPGKRRSGIAHALVKMIWAEHPEGIGRYPHLRMSKAMHGFLTSLMRREGLDQHAPSMKLRKAV